eukprot:TRINITY_DN69742_c0_g1_i1.p1 TRINITY_DN69742_c0_g1~~TRINITY_DN69742_c0_g1_i1.p1  ORF type:complete len:157 (+),score=42.29 TRINITY_DN69742_c0_g1_i1:71-541(+)
MKFAKFAVIFALAALAEGLEISTTSAAKVATDTKNEAAKLPNSDEFHPPKIWGPHGWFLLHSVSLALPDEVPKHQQESVKSLMVALQSTLPCPVCAGHLKEFMEENPIDGHLDKREKLVDYMIKAHNNVNKRNGKGEFTRDQVVKHFLGEFIKKEL